MSRIILRWPVAVLLTAASAVAEENRPGQAQPERPGVREHRGAKVGLSQDDDAFLQGPLVRLPWAIAGWTLSGFSPDEKFFAFGGRVWEVATGRLVAELDGKGAIVFSAEGTPLEVTREANTVRVREVFSGKTVLETPGRDPWVANLSPPWSLSSPLMFVPTGADRGAAELWNVEGKRLLRFENAELHQDLDTRRSNSDFLHEWLTVSQDGSRLAWLSPARKIYVWSLDTPDRHPRVLVCEPAAGETKLHTRGDALVLSLDGDRLAALEHIDEGTRRSGVIAIWNASTGKRCCLIRQDVTGVATRPPWLLHLSFSVSGSELLTFLCELSDTRDVRTPEVLVWDTRTGRQVRRWRFQSREDFARFAASSDAYCLGYGRHCQFSPLRRSPVGSRALGSCSWLRGWFLISDDGFYLVAGHPRTLRETASQLSLAELPDCFSGMYSTFSPRSRYLATSRRGPDNRVDAEIWELGPAPTSRRQASSDVSALMVELWGVDAGRAQRAVRDLIGIGDPVLRELQAQLRGLAEPVVLDERIGKLIGQLDDDRFEVREAASSELENLGRAAKEALQRTVRENPSAEVRHRAKRLLLAIERLPQPAEGSFELRAVQVLDVRFVS